MCTRKLSLLTAAILAGAMTAASAADLAMKAPPVPAAIYNWSGFYLGANAGGTWGNDPVAYNPQYVNAPAGFPAQAASDGSRTFRPAGATAGGQAGYNWQASQFVFGLEGDVEYVDLTSSYTTPVLGFPNVPSYFFATSVKSNWMATIRPRAGITFDRLLVYVTGGVAFSDISFAQAVTFSGFGQTNTGAGSASATKMGWTAGVGFEYAFAPHWSARLEYLHADFGSIGFAAVNNVAGISSTSSVSSRTNLARVGLNYSFGGGPVVAKY